MLVLSQDGSILKNSLILVRMFSRGRLHSLGEARFRIRKSSFLADTRQSTKEAFNDQEPNRRWLVMDRKARDKNACAHDWLLDVTNGRACIFLGSMTNFRSEWLKL